MIDRDPMERWLEGLMDSMFRSFDEQMGGAAAEPDPLALDDWTRFVAWGLRREVRARKHLAIEFRVPATPHSDHAHRLLLRAGARVCPCCGGYIFPVDPLARFMAGNPRLAARCPLCEVR